MNRPIKIIFIIDHFKNDGGAQQALYLLISGLDKKKFSPFVVCLNKDEVYARKYQQIGVGTKVYNTGLKNGLYVLLDLFYLLLKEKPDIVHTFLFYSDIIGRVLSKLARVPIILSSVRCTNIDHKPWQFLLSKFTARYCDKVTFVTRKSIDFACANEGVRPEQIVVIPNGKDIDGYALVTDRASIKKEYGIKEDCLVVGVHGRLNWQKGHVHLINCARRVLKEKPNTVFFILGKGPLEGRLKNLTKSLDIESNFKFLSPPHDVPRFLNILDIFVLPSLYEGLSNSLLEAMAAGKAIVATEVDGNLDAMDTDSGILIPPQNEKALEEAIIKLIDDRELREKLGKAARLRVKDKFSLDDMVQEYQNLYASLYQSGPRLC